MAISLGRYWPISLAILRRWIAIFRPEGLAECPFDPTMQFMELSQIESIPEQTRIRLILLDDHLLFRESLARLLASERDFELVAECTTPVEALKYLKRPGVDVILVDIGIAKDFIPWAQRIRYSGKSLVIARQLDATGSAAVLKYGASGIFLASDSSGRLMQAIRLVASGEAWVQLWPYNQTVT
jgi:hypothetical protein